MTRDSIAYGNDNDRHLDAFQPFAEAGYDEIYITQIGGTQPETSSTGFSDFDHDLLPSLRELAA